jgi:Uma2 family endonuclease
MADITLPETKPALEWVNGRALQKVSPKRKHSIAQTRFAAALDSWTRRTRAGIAGTEWRFQVQPPGEDSRPLVPDVAFLSYERLPYEVQQVTDVPIVAPDVVVEALSP